MKAMRAQRNLAMRAAMTYADAILAMPLETCTGQDLLYALGIASRQELYSDTPASKWYREATPMQIYQFCREWDDFKAAHKE